MSNHRGARPTLVVRRAGAWTMVVVLASVVLVFAGTRLVTDVPYIASGTTPHPLSFEYRYAAYPWLAYAHIAPGIVFLLLAPIQLWRGFRDRHATWHRRIGRIAIVAGFLSGICAVVFGLFLSYGGALQASAAVLFGIWFITALAIAYRAIRQREVRHHRRWMIRAYAVALGVGTIRLWIGLLTELGVLPLRDAFGVAFWLAFVMHTAAAELWLRRRPMSYGVARATG